MNFIILLTLLFVFVLFWHNASSAKEHAIFKCRKFCKEIDCQLLDETVALISIQAERKQNGWLAFKRRYRFEVTIDGYQRCRGEIELFANQLKLIHLDHPDGIIINSPETKTLH